MKYLGARLLTHLDALTAEMAVSNQLMSERFLEAFRKKIYREQAFDVLPPEVSDKIVAWTEYYFGVAPEEVDDDFIDDHKSKMHPDTAFRAFQELMVIRADFQSQLINRGVGQ